MSPARPVLVAVLKENSKLKVLCICLLLGSLFKDCQGKCTLAEITDDPETKQNEEKLLKRIEPLSDKEFETKDEKYIYHVKVCDKVSNGEKGIGATQVEPGKTPAVSLGMFNQAEVMGGTNWILLTYLNGSSYRSHCNASERMTQIMLVCNPSDLVGKLSLLAEKRKNVSSRCSYWFELDSSVACTIIAKKENPPSHGLSSGGVFCILFFTFAGLYLIIGFLYKRLIVGSKGIEQIPNYSFWRAFGNLQADACDFICRCGPRQESQAYRGIDDRLKTEEHDDQLLNM